jgi:hypothetical protein
MTPRELRCLHLLLDGCWHKREALDRDGGVVRVGVYRLSAEGILWARELLTNALASRSAPKSA